MVATRRRQCCLTATIPCVDADGNTRKEKVLQVLGFSGLDRVEVESATAGDIVAFSGIPEPRISDTLCAPEHVEELPALTVDEPTIRMTFETNTSPFSVQITSQSTLS